MNSDSFRKVWQPLPERVGVYQIETPTKRYYIGYSKNVRQRVRLHCNEALRGVHCNKRLMAAILKHGAKIKVKILCYCQTEEDAVQLESQYIKMFFHDKNCMNQCDSDPVRVVNDWERPNTRVAYIMNAWSKQAVLFYSTKSRQRWIHENGSKSQGENTFVIGYSIEECLKKSEQKQRRYILNVRGGGNCVFNNIWHRTIGDAYEYNKQKFDKYGIGRSMFERRYRSGCHSFWQQLRAKRLAMQAAGGSVNVIWDNKIYHTLGRLDRSIEGISVNVLKKLISFNINNTEDANSVLENCTNRDNFTCCLQFYFMGRFWPNYQKCQDEHKISFVRLKTLIENEQD